METRIRPSLAVVGASNNPEKYGYRIYKDLLHSGYRVFPINPRGGKILGQDVFRTLTELSRNLHLQDRQDLIVIIVVPPEVTKSILQECATLGLQHIWMQPGSSSDSLVAEAQELGLDVTANACFMVRNGIWKTEQSFA